MKLKLYTCKEVTELTCSEEKLGFIDRLNYRFHLFICKNCQIYTQQIKDLRQQMKQAMVSKANESSKTNRQTLREEIIKKTLQKN